MVAPDSHILWSLNLEGTARPAPPPVDGGPQPAIGGTGPVVNPGSYQARLTTKGGAQSVPLEVLLDPRLKDTVTEQDTAGHWDLAMKANEDVEALHRAVNQMRTLRSDLETMKKWAGGKPDAKALLDSADAFDKKMRPIEEQLIQVNMKASEDNLRYPNQLNEQYDTFVATVDATGWGWRASARGARETSTPYPTATARAATEPLTRRLTRRRCGTRRASIFCIILVPDDK